MRRTIFDTPIVKHVMRVVALLYLRTIGWRLEGTLPDAPKYVVIVAYHTSNWDFPILVALAFALRVKSFWMGKHTLFRRPFGPFFRWLGGIPIDRNSPHNVVAQCIEHFEHNDSMVLTIAPEGTRKKVPFWKTGFYRIACGAKVPIVMAFVDYRRKVGGIAAVVTPTGDIEADIRIIRDVYANVTAKYPDQAVPPKVRPSTIDNPPAP